ncbi:protoporphyrinogen oxidase [Bacillus sp. AGMB 02131]|uniref:Coproporphyrinogen III oxidase n=1 Tax=Peribacillus faecalis TaxID=2772559 RepID=A0A927HC43_9BACI|nr:protoporphyrinogen oxidase [Peribacillus faecalis]MBD3108038.1 protoporphyrinogen oxidase [Peribacillus faecalis]
MKRIVVIGGGITGLSTMYYLQKWKRNHNSDVELLLVEQNDRLGGKIRTVYENGFKMESGADSIVASKKDVLPFIEELELEEQVVYNATGTSFIHTNNELHLIPENSVFGIPVNKEALYKSTLLSEAGKERVLEEMHIENTHFTKEDSIGEFLEYLLGKEIVENQIAPILSGVYSGSLHDLSIASTLPHLLDYKNEYGSIIRGLEANQEQTKRNKKKFLSFKNGLSTLIDTIEEKLTDVTILKGIKTTSIEKAEGGYTIFCDNHEELQANYIVLSIPDQAAKRLLHDPELDEDFAKFKNSSLISIYFGFDLPDSKLPADGTGFIVSKNSDLMCNACTWTSRKWPNTSEDGKLLVRLFYKSTIPAYPQMDQMDEEQLREAGLNDVEKALGFREQPVSTEITKWKEAMPNYTIQHPESIQSINEKLQRDYPNVYIAGCSYYGVGIGACITNGIETAEQVAESLRVAVK